MAKRVKIGDIIKFELNDGVAYALYTHKTIDFGSVIRVYNEIYKKPQLDISEKLYSLDPSFTRMFPLQIAVNKGVVEIVGNIDIPEKLKEFPLFRTPKALNLKTGEATAWCLWDGEKLYDIEELTDKLRMLPLRTLCNDTSIIKKIETNFKDENLDV